MKRIVTRVIIMIMVLGTIVSTGNTVRILIPVRNGKKENLMRIYFTVSVN